MYARQLLTPPLRLVPCGLLYKTPTRHRWSQPETTAIYEVVVYTIYFTHFFTGASYVIGIIILEHKQIN